MKRHYTVLIRTLSALMVMTLTAGMFAACKSEPEKTEDSTTSQSTENSDPGTPDKSDYVMEYGDTLKIEGNAVTVEDTSIAEVKNGVLTAKAVGTTTLTVDGETKTLTVDPAVVDVVLFTGQSNMVGRETSKYTVDIPAGQAYEYKYLGGGSLTEVKNPVGETFGEVEVSSGSSIVPQFCADYVRSGRKIVAVHLARGGRSINYFTSNGGAIYKDITQKYGACIEYLTNSENFTVGHKFYVMYQGESDTNNNMTAAAYTTRYMSFHSGLKKKFGFEFGAMIANGRNSDPVNHEGIKRIEEAKEAICKDNDDIIMADVSPYNWYIAGDYSNIRSDLIHLNAEGLKIVASEACKNILNYMGLGSDPSLKGIDPVTYLEIKDSSSGNDDPGTDDPGDDTPAPAPIEGTEYFWDFEDGKVTDAKGNLTAEKNGTVTPTIENGIYKNSNNNYLRYHLSKSITLSKDSDWSVEWKGKAYNNMSNNASILLSNGENMFLTFQNSRGVYLRNGDNRFDISDKISVSEIYNEHTWLIYYSAEQKTVSVYMDGKLVKSGSWNVDLTFADMLGCTNNQYTFVGELDYIKITVG